MKSPALWLLTRLTLAHGGASAAPLDPGLTARDARRVLWRIACNALRGALWRARLGACGGRLLVAPGVRIDAPERLRVGRGVKVEELVELQCLARGGVVLGDGVTIGRGACIRPSSYYGGELGEGLTVGAGTAIGAYGWIGASGRVELGREVLLGPRVVILPENHRFDALDLPIRAQGVERRGVVVEDDCWIGANVTLLAGVRIGRGSVIAAGAVVTRDIPPGSIAAGVPARVIRSREPIQGRAPGAAA